MIRLSELAEKLGISLEELISWVSETGLADVQSDTLLDEDLVAFLESKLQQNRLADLFSPEDYPDTSNEPEMETGSQEIEFPSFPGEEEFSRKIPVDIGDPDLLVESLSRLDEVGPLPSEPEPIEVPEELNIEGTSEEKVQDEVPYEEFEIQPESPTLVEEPTIFTAIGARISSEALQSQLDDLTRDMVLPEETVPSEPRPTITSWIHDLIGKVSGQLSPQHKLIILASLAGAVAIISLSGYLHSRSYGKDGDKRFYESGMRFLNSNEHEKAFAEFQKVIRRYPNSPFFVDSHFKIASIYRHLDRKTEAEREMREALRLQTVWLGDATEEWSLRDQDLRETGFKFLGDLLSEKKDWEGAREWYNRILEQSQDENLLKETKFLFAKTLDEEYKSNEARAIDLRRALDAYSDALKSSPTSPHATSAQYRSAVIHERLALMELGLFDSHMQAAIDLYRLLELNPEDVAKAGMDPLDISLDVARLEREMGNTTESIRLYRQIEAKPRDIYEDGPLPHKVSFGLSRSLIRAAQEYSRNNQSASAEVVLYEVLERTRNRDEHPFDENELTESLYLRGHALYELGRAAIRKDRNEADSYYSKMDNAYQSALSRNESFGKDGEDSLLAMVRRTNYRFQINQDYRDSVRSYQKVLELFPDNRYSYICRFRLAEALFMLKEYRDAEEQYRLVVDEFPKIRYTDDEAFRQAYYRLGDCQFLLNDFDRASRTYKSLLELVRYEETPEALRAWRLLAESYYRQGKYDQAVDELKSFLAKYPSHDVEGKIRLTLGRTLLARFDYEEGRAELRKVIDERPTSEISRWARYILSESFLDQSRSATGVERENLLQQALKEAENIRIVFPDEDRPLALMGRAHFELGDYERAARELEYYHNAARSAKPPSINNLVLGEAYYRMGQYDKAIIALKRVTPDDITREEAARSLSLLAESLRFEKQLEESLATFELLVNEYPTSPYSNLARDRAGELKWRIAQGIR